MAAFSGCEAGSGPSTWLDAPIEGNVLARRFTATEGTESVTITCTLREDPEEVHHASGLGEVSLYGLLADATYDCEGGAGADRLSTHFTTEPLPDFIPEWTMPVAGEGSSYTLFNAGNNDRSDQQTKLMVVDHAGRLRWYNQVPYDAPDLDSSYLGAGQFLYGGGFAAPPTVIDLAGNTLLQAPKPSAGPVWHHHAERLETGEFVALGTTQNSDGTTQWAGATVEFLDAEMTAPTEVWNTQQGVDDGWLPVGDEGDPYHLNAVVVAGNDLYVNFRNLSLFCLLDRSTGERVWSLGNGGDFELVRADGTADDPANWMYGAHAPEKTDDHLLFYDNGDGSLEQPQSRIVEFQIDQAARTAEVLWSYTEPGWYEPIWGDVDRLPDNNLLFTRAHAAGQDPEDPDTTQIVELDGETFETRWRLVMSDGLTTGYRSERIDGCAIFSNDLYCPPGA